MTVEERVLRLRLQRRQIDAMIAGLQNGLIPLLEARREGGVTPSIVALQLDCSVQSANNRCRALLDADIVYRRQVNIPGGGRTYSYALQTL